jgi:hypothetical protein
MISLALFAAAAVSSPMPGQLRTFTDWIVGCDNGRACQASGLFPGDDFDALTMAVARGPEREARPRIWINTEDLAVASLTADGRRLPVRLMADQGVTSVHPDDAIAFVEAAKAARQLGLLDASGAELGHTSLAGLNAAFLYMDDQQKRVGTVTALVRKGARPASTVPAPPPLPLIVPPPVPKIPPRRLSKADVAREQVAHECDVSESEDFAPTHVRLDARTTLALLPTPCDNGAYNFFGSALLIDQSGNVRPARLDSPAGMSPENDNSLVNGYWDEKERLLSTYEKGRGLGDCGTMQSFAWDGSQFRLVKRSDMGECRGSTDYITTWRAAVSRR